MRYYFSLILLSLFMGCKKDNSPVGDQGALKAGFSYVNPQGKALIDSIIIIPVHLSRLPISHDHPYYEGATFKSKITRKDGREQSLPSSLFLKWILYDLDKNTVIKTDSALNISLQVAKTGRYRLSQYIFKTKQGSESVRSAIDSASKIIEVTDFKQIDSISIDTLTLQSPFITYDFNREATFDAILSFYNSKQEATNHKKPIFETAILKSLQLGATNVKFYSIQPTFIPTFDTLSEKDSFYIQLAYLQGEKKFRIMDNDHGLIFKYYKTGYLAFDKSSINEERKLRFGNMTLKISSSFKFMQ